jgi:hypothetical protein
MDALPVAQHRATELAELRRRAYGPNADIHNDPAALARLHELETLERPPLQAAQEVADAGIAEHRERADAAAPTVSTWLDDLAPTREHGEPRADGEPRAADDEPSDEVVAPEKNGRRRAKRIAAAAGVFVMGVAVGVLAVISLQPQPAFTMAAQEGLGDIDPTLPMQFGYWGEVDEGSMTSYGTFGEFDVWSASGDGGSTCLFLTDGIEFGGMGCADVGLDPLVDIGAFYGYGRIEDDRIPSGSTARLLLQDGRIEGWLSEPDLPEVTVYTP